MWSSFDMDANKWLAFQQLSIRFGAYVVYSFLSIDCSITIAPHIHYTYWSPFLAFNLKVFFFAQNIVGKEMTSYLVEAADC